MRNLRITDSFLKLHFVCLLQSQDKYTKNSKPVLNIVIHLNIGKKIVASTNLKTIKMMLRKHDIAK